jgi:hypothetical protein
LVNPIQLSTKCAIPCKIVQLLNNWPSNYPKPIVYTSFTTISLNNKIEPNAYPIQDRAQNLTLNNERWIAGAMIKPLLKISLNDKFLFYELFSLYNPDLLIIGPRYTPRKKKGYSPHPFEKKWYATTLLSSEIEFSKFFRSLNVPIFYSSLCGTASILNSHHALEIYQNHPKLCINCGLCEKFIRASV